jgi:hypothetical protein
MMAAKRDSVIEAETLLDETNGPNPLVGIKIWTELKRRTLDAYRAAGPGGSSLSNEAEANVATEELLNRRKDPNGSPKDKRVHSSRLFRHSTIPLFVRTLTPYAARSNLNYPVSPAF